VAPSVPCVDDEPVHPAFHRPQWLRGLQTGAAQAETARQACAAHTASIEPCCARSSREAHRKAGVVGAAAGRETLISDDGEQMIAFDQTGFIDEQG